MAVATEPGQAQSAPTQHRWDLSVPWSAQEFHTRNAERFARAVTKATAGAVQITVHPGAVLGLKGPESLRALGEGVVQMAEMPGTQQIGAAPILGLDSLPFLIADQTDLRRFDRLLRPVMEEVLAEHNVKLLYRVPWPNQNMFFNRPIRRLSDLEGLRMRTYDRLSSALVRNLGMQSVQMPLGDVVPALAAGGLDATMTSTTTAAAQRYWSFFDIILRTNHTWVSNMMAVNLDAWRKLSPDHRAAIGRVAAELEPDFWAVARADDRKQLNRLVEAGMTVQSPSNDLADAMRQAAKPIWTRFLAQARPEAGEILTAFQRRQARDDGS